jgi:hypothetical protein
MHKRKRKIDRKKMKARRTFALMNMSDGSMMEEPELKKKKRKSVAIVIHPAIRRHIGFLYLPRLSQHRCIFFIIIYL